MGLVRRIAQRRRSETGCKKKRKEKKKEKKRNKEKQRKREN